MVQATNEHINLINTSCEQNNLSCYMSRFCPTDERETLAWNLIEYRSETIGHIWLEKVDEATHSTKMGIAIWNQTALGHGIGKIVIHEMIELAKTMHDVENIILNVRKENRRAINCYLAVGFAIYAEGKNRSDDKDIPILRMKYLI